MDTVLLFVRLGHFDSAPGHGTDAYVRIFGKIVSQRSFYAYYICIQERRHTPYPILVPPSTSELMKTSKVKVGLGRCY